MTEPIRIFELIIPPQPTLHVIISQGYLTDKAISFQLRTFGAEVALNPRASSSLKEIRYKVQELLEKSKEKHLVVTIQDYLTLKWVDVKSKETGIKPLYYVCDGIDEPVFIYPEYDQIECQLMKEYSDLIDADIAQTLGNLGRKKEDV